MEVLRPDFKLDSFFDALNQSGNRALLLDYDGTLAPFKVNRNEALPYPDVMPAIDAIMGTGGCRVVIISGRTIEEIKPLLALKNLPEIWGSHGWERLWPDGKYEVTELTDSLKQGLASAYGWLVVEGLVERAEEKPGSVALHWRGLEPTKIQELEKKTLENWQPIAAGADLQIHSFDGGLELRAPGRDKGYAIKKIASEMGRGVVSYLGDDLTDEDAFRALDKTGLGVLVNQRLRSTAATLWIKPPGELLQFLKRWKQAL